ncbi:MAG: methionyl-tRNA formyltransferase [Candidatus Omnitrophica bacterium]|nr:methionyl-tRNA formyltransferase [Candidatus Omnitrophota bacterium]
MRVIFFGTGDYGIPSLKRLATSGHDIVAVVTQPDKRQGRGWNFMPHPIKAISEKVFPGTDIFQPENVNSEDFIAAVKSKDADLFVVIDYGQFLCKKVLDMPKKFCVNLHASLLPKYRGASPVNWAVVRGETETGNTVFRMNERMDAGDVIASSRVRIGEAETTVELSERLSLNGAELLVKTLDSIASGGTVFEKQDDVKATYAPKLKKEDGRIDWTRSAEEIMRQIRGMQPWPGAYTLLRGKILKIFQSEIVDDVTGIAPGSIAYTEDFTVETGKGALRLKLLQLEGKKCMENYKFLRGFRLEKGEPLGE